MKLARTSSVLAIIVLISMVGALVGCGSPAPTATPVPAPTAAPKAAPTAAPAAAVAAPTTAPKPAAPAPTAAPAAIKPNMVVFSTFDIGGAGYMYAATVGEAILKGAGVKVRVIPAATATARQELVRSGAANVVFHGGDVVTEGLTEFADINWGPQPLRLLWHTVYYGQSFGVPANSDIKKMSDLRGKRVGASTASPTSQMNRTAKLAFGGLTWNDVKRMDFTTTAPEASALKAGQLDAMQVMVDSAQGLEVASSSAGLRILPLDKNDAEGWARYHKIYPWAYGRTVTEGAGITGPTDVETFSYPSALAYPNLDDNIAYFITRTLDEVYPLYGTLTLQNKVSTLQNALDIIGKSFIPYHNGSIRYFKEKGLWTKEQDAWTKALVNRQGILKKVWDDAVVAQQEQKITAAKFAAFWMERRPKVENIYDEIWTEYQRILKGS